MPNRILKDSICTSPNIAKLSRDAEVFFYRLITQCDDYGRMDARPAILRARCYPLQIEQVTECDVVTWLIELSTAQLVAVYTVGDTDYLQMLTWEKHQQIRAKRSKYPAIPSIDSNGYQMISSDSICPRNPIQSESESNPNLNPIHDTTTTEATDIMVQQWEDVLGLTLTPAIFPEVKAYMDKLIAAGAVEWWIQALRETTGARRPGWPYMKSVLIDWLNHGRPSGKQGKNGTDPVKPKAKVTHVINPFTDQVEAL